MIGNNGYVKRGLKVEKLKYAEIVIEEVHNRTIHGSLEWKDNQDYIAAQPTPAIRVSIAYTDDGPDMATWEHVILFTRLGRT